MLSSRHPSVAILIFHCQSYFPSRTDIRQLLFANYRFCLKQRHQAVMPSSCIVTFLVRTVVRYSPPRDGPPVSAEVATRCAQTLAASSTQARPVIVSTENFMIPVTRNAARVCVLVFQKVLVYCGGCCNYRSADIFFVSKRVVLPSEAVLVR
jgi:hypothetical protein